MAPSRANPFYSNDNPTINDLHLLGKEIMSRAGKRLGTIYPGGTEDRRFRSFFGCGVIVCLDGWYKMKTLGIIPKRGARTGMVVHYLWALMFMKLYSTESALCGHAGGVDPKTSRKWIWPFIHAIAELEYTVVSLVCC